MADCDWNKCTRSFTSEDGWSNRFCEGHRILGQVNKDSHGGGITIEQYKEQYEKARQWFKDNPIAEVNE